MKKKIDWLNHSLEFVVVLIGILIAFQLNKCSENNSQQKLLDNHLEYIEIENRENQDQIIQGIKHIKNQIKYCDTILYHVAGPKDIKSIRNFAYKLLDMRNVTLDENAYQVLSQSGDIRYLTDYKLKRNIISLYDSFDRVNDINQSNQKLYDNHFYPYLKSNFDLVSWPSVIPESDEEKSNYYSKEFANTISTYKYLLEYKLNIYQKEQDIIDEYLSE